MRNTTRDMTITVTVLPSIEPPPCAFCGEPPAEFDHTDDSDNPEHIIECGNEKCPAESLRVVRPTREEAVRAWVILVNDQDCRGT